ncbi:MAG TPA: cupin domain-containing protein [Geobacteraceae bacterium]|nr:cupin domain-containing protein [Geobacteraceae bacterium]
MEAIIIYWSNTGNTEKVARSVQEGLHEAGMNVSLLGVQEAEDVDFFAYDLVCIGFPSYQWSPPKPMDNFLKRKFSAYRDQGRVKWGAPTVPGKNALIFCTYSGPHTGIREAIPAGLYAGQFFEHLGFTVLDEWYVAAEFHGSEAASTEGRLGDVRGLPSVEDLNKVKRDASLLAGRMNTVPARERAIDPDKYLLSLAGGRNEPIKDLNNATRVVLVDKETVGADDITFAYCKFEAGTSLHRKHIHRDAEEVIHILAGKGISGIGDTEMEMRRGDTMFIPRGEVHWFHNPFDEPVEMLFIYTRPSLKSAGYEIVE